jgi:hypothetical protein
MASDSGLMITIQVPRALHQRLKVAAIMANVSLKKFVALWLETAVGPGLLKAKNPAKTVLSAHSPKHSTKSK